MFRPIWPSSGVKIRFNGGTAALVVAVVIYFPQMRTYVCNTYEISLGFCVCAGFLCDVWLRILCTHCGYCVFFLQPT
jgi:hypothetical protein